MEKKVKIAVLMSTYNGEKYIEEQIDSVLNQNIHVDIYIRDDGSTDETVSILKKYEEKFNIYVEYGDNLGYKKSFMKLLLNTKGYDFYAFCDQDDFWIANKISSAIQMIKKYDEIPALYYSNLKKCDENLCVYGVTDLHKRVMSLQSNILRRSIAGCTIVINKKFWKIISAIGLKDELLIQGHDSYLVSLCYAIEGKVICDKNSYILYRQHGDNTSGASNGIIQRIQKEYSSVKKNKLNEYTMAKAIIKFCPTIISKENMLILQEFIEYKKSLKRKMKIIVSRKYSTGKGILTFWGKIKIMFGLL